MAKSKKPAAKSAKPAQAKPAAVKAAETSGESAAKAVTEKAAEKTGAVKTSAASSASKVASATAKSSAQSKQPDIVKKAAVSEKPAPTMSVEAAAPKPQEPVKSGTAPTPTPDNQERRGGFLPLVLGGVIAGGIGYFAAENNWFTGADNTNAQLIAEINANAERLSALETAEVDLSAIDTLGSDVETLAATLADIDARLALIEQRPASDGGPSLADQVAFEEELKALKASAEEQRVEIAALLENAQTVEQATAAAAQSAQIQSAVSQITAALGTGQPFADTLATLESSGIEVPDALSDVAEGGVVTLINLQSRFPDTARAALGVARTTGAVEGESGIGGFLKRQLGARSTQPREGSDPDAILSRAEAAVRDGGLETALTEIDTLPQDVQSAMQDWLDDARARNAAQSATQDLSQSLLAN